MDNTQINKPLVSVIMPCYNQGAYLGEALNSILAQTYTNWECIIIDDGSKDNSGQIARSYADSDKRIRLISQDNKGVSAARNNAIQQSSGIYILPLDADDKIDATYIEEAVTVMESNPGTKLVYCEAKLFGIRSGPWKLPPYSYKRLLVENLIFCSAVFRRSDFDAKPHYDESMSEGFEDWEFWIAFLSENDKVYQIPKPLFNYRIKQASGNPGFAEAERQKRIRKYIFLKHRSVYEKYIDSSDILFDYYRSNELLASIQNSMSYRLGKWLLWPFHMLKKIFK